MIENTFGILATRFRIFRRPIVAKAQTVTQITKCAVTLHNFLMKNRSPNDTYSYCSTSFTDQTTTGVLDGEWRREGKGDGFPPIPRVGSNNYSREAKRIRDQFKDYFCSPEGAVSWQWNMVIRTSHLSDELR